MKKGLLLAALMIGAVEFTNAQENGEPPFGMSEVAAFSVFTDAIRNNDHEMALQFGSWMLVAQPREMEGVITFRLDRQFERLIGVYTGMAEQESDPTEKRNLLEKAVAIFDLAFEIFEEDEIDLYRWHHQRARFYQEHHSALRVSIDKAFEGYEKAYELDAEQFTEGGGGYFAGILLSHYVSSGQRDKAMAMIDEIEEIASAELLQEIDEMRERLFDSPEERIAFIESRIEAAEGDDREIMMQSLVDLYNEVGRTDDAVSTARGLYEINPNFENTRRLADNYLSEGNYRSAIPYLEELVDLSPTPDVKGGVLIELGDAHQQINDLQAARRYTRRALSEGDNRGQALFQISIIYSAAVIQCTEGQALSREDRTVYWLVIDYLERAMQADGGLRTIAQQRIENFRAAMPTAEHKFFSGWETGDSFRINGDIGECYAWINEETTVK